MNQSHPKPALQDSNTSHKLKHRISKTQLNPTRTSHKLKHRISKTQLNQNQKPREQTCREQRGEEFLYLICHCSWPETPEIDVKPVKKTKAFSLRFSFYSQRFEKPRPQTSSPHRDEAIGTGFVRRRGRNRKIPSQLPEVLPFVPLPPSTWWTATTLGLAVLRRRRWDQFGSVKWPDGRPEIGGVAAEERRGGEGSERSLGF